MCRRVDNMILLSGQGNGADSSYILSSCDKRSALNQNHAQSSIATNQAQRFTAQICMTGGWGLASGLLINDQRLMSPNAASLYSDL